MTGKMTFASPALVLAMSIAWAGACLGLDYTFNPQLWGRTVATAPSAAPLSLHFHHLRCQGCEDAIRRALGTLPWLQGAEMTVRTTGADTAVGNFAGWLDISVADIAQIDFIALDLALRQEGFVASEMDFGGPLHYRLEGQARHLCCPTCTDACEPLPDLGQVRRGQQLTWLDSLTTDGSTVVFHVRYQQATDRIDVKELFAAMDDFGLFPSSLHVVVAPE
jgi:hypothetical protein